MPRRLEASRMVSPLLWQRAMASPFCCGVNRRCCRVMMLYGEWSCMRREKGQMVGLGRAAQKITPTPPEQWLYGVEEVQTCSSQLRAPRKIPATTRVYDQDILQLLIWQAGRLAPQAIFRGVRKFPAIGGSTVLWFVNKNSHTIDADIKSPNPQRTPKLKAF
jgi:hypothetical protein